MKLFDHIRGIFDDAQACKLEHALLHACIAVDATSRQLYPLEKKVGRRFIKCIRDYYWLVEPMMGVGFNLVETKFDNLHLPGGKSSPDFAEVIYHIHRCSHAHGEETPIGYELTKSVGGFISNWEIAPNLLRMPDRVIWALAAIAVFSRVNYRLKGQGGSFYLSWGNEKFFVSSWWGKEKEIRLLAETWNTTRIKLDGLAAMRSVDSATGATQYLFTYASPPSKMN